MRNRALLACCALVLAAPARAQTWRQTAVLVPPGIQPGDKFGEKLDAEGDLLVVAAHGDDALGPSTGAVYVLERDPALAQPWVLRQKLLASNAAAGAQFGYRVSVEGEGFVVYASAGGLTFFERGPNGLWAETEVLGVPAGTGHVALDGDSLALSVPFALAQQEGAVHLYARDAQTGSWSFAQLLTASDGEAFGSFAARSPCAVTTWSWARWATSSSASTRARPTSSSASRAGPGSRPRACTPRTADRGTCSATPRSSTARSA
jgi:hypothetical protein